MTIAPTTSDTTGFDCVIPAAGASSRMGAWKLLLPWRGVTVIEAVVEKALSCCSRAIVVAGHRAGELETLFAGNGRVLVVRNPDWKKGMFTSIKRGAAEVRTEAFFVALADMPLVSDATFRMLHALRLGSCDGPRVFRPFSDGRPGHPVLFDAAALPIIAETGEALSMNEVLMRMEVVPLSAAAGEGAFLDFDSPDDYGLADPFAVLVTGSIGAGKTGALAGAARLLRSRGVTVASCLQPAAGRPGDPSAGGGTGHPAVPGKVTGARTYRMELADGHEIENLPLARRVEGGAEAAEAAGSDEIAFGPYRFSRSAFARCAAFLRAAPSRKTPVVMLDEIGKLELDRGEGLAETLETTLTAFARDEGYPRALVLAVRRDKLDAFASALRSRGIGSVWLDLDLARGGMDGAAASLEAAVLVSLARGSGAL